MKKYNGLLFPLIAVLGCVALPSKAADVLPPSHVEFSAGMYYSNLQVNDRSGEKMFARESGLSVRGLVYPVRWLAVGVEGVQFGRENLPAQNTYRDKRLGLLTKWILTPDTTPAIYVLLGMGQQDQRVSYQDLWTSKSHTRYTQAGLGIDIPVYRYVFIGAEGQLIYHAHQKVDDLLVLNRRLEYLLSLRVGVKF